MHHWIHGIKDVHFPTSGNTNFPVRDNQSNFHIKLLQLLPLMRRPNETDNRHSQINVAFLFSHLM